VRGVAIPRFYPIVDTAACRARGIDPSAFARGLFQSGARFLQLRAKEEKEEHDRGILGLADAVVAVCPPDSILIINDRADVALMSGASGVHVGQDDLPVEDVRRIGPNLLVGLSTHTREQVDAAVDSPADYIAVGPVFGTATKDTGYAAVGLALVRYAVSIAAGRPVVAIGGITLEHAPKVVEAGAAAVAVVGDLFAAPVETRVAQYLKALA
jgi:thiamine-phosphate pyrophosphorylase